MGAQQSKDELLYQQVNYGNADGIRQLRSQGAGLEWIDREGRTPLIAACLRPDLLNVAKVLIELGANVNAFRPGVGGGTPLHHAAKKGLEQTVQLLLANGANLFVLNDECHSPLDLAREKGHVNVVRTIEARIALFCGWMRETYGPGFLDALVPQWVTRKIWTVVIPCDARNPTRPLKFELAIYPDLLTPKPRTTLQLWKCHVEAPKFSQADPFVIIQEKTTKTRHKFLPAHEGDKQQIQWFFNACQGQAQQILAAPPAGSHLPIPYPSQPPVPVLGHSPVPTGNRVDEDVELAMAINASIQSAIAEGVPGVRPITVPINVNKSDSSSTSGNSSSFNGWGPPSASIPQLKASGEGGMSGSSSSMYNGWLPEPSLKQSSSAPNMVHAAGTSMPSMAHEAPPAVTTPSAPPLTDATFYDQQVSYPAIDSSPTSVSTSTASGGGAAASEGAADPPARTAGTCVVCLDAPAEAACIPCGHVAGCMSCLQEIKAKNWGCPICRANIVQVIKLYAV